jgi:hypothetical protein
MVADPDRVQPDILGGVGDRNVLRPANVTFDLRQIGRGHCSNASTIS